MSPSPRNPLSKNPLVWSYALGRKRFNRVGLIRRAGWSIIMMTWREGGRRRSQSLRHANKQRAIVQAMEKAAELAARRPTHEPQVVILAMRADLVRVGAMLGLPAGVAPSRTRYHEHGRFSECRVRAAFKGWRKTPDGPGGNPVDQWLAAMGRFGLKPVSSTLTADYARCAADVRRVAMLLGSPRRMPSVNEYDRLGNFTPDTIRKYLRTPRWPDIADALHLEMSAERRDASVTMRARVTGHPHESERAA